MADPFHPITQIISQAQELGIRRQQTGNVSDARLTDELDGPSFTPSWGIPCSFLYKSLIIFLQERWVSSCCGEEL